MYFPTGSAKQLSGSVKHEEILACVPNGKKSLFCTVTESSVSVWRVRPTTVLAHLERTPLSLATHGTNVLAAWAPDGNRIVICTTTSHLVLITVNYSSSYIPYSSTNVASASAQRHFLPGPGEGHPLPAISLRFEGVVRIEGDVVSISPRYSHILFATSSPPAIQRIPWPSEVARSDRLGERSKGDKWIGHDTWFLTGSDLPWLLRRDTTVQRIAYSRAVGAEVWITSDGRAYFVTLYETDDEDDEDQADNEEDPNTAIGSLTTANSQASSTRQSNASTSNSERRRTGYDLETQLPDGEPSRQDVAWEGTCIHGVPVTTIAVDQDDGSAAPVPQQGQTSEADSGQEEQDGLGTANSMATLRQPSHSRRESVQSTVMGHGDHDPQQSGKDPDTTITKEDDGEESESDPDENSMPHQERHEILSDEYQATSAAINAKFSIVAIGTRGGTIYLTNFPLSGRPPPPSSAQALSIPQHWTKTGAVQTMEWTSDGYALAVGWERGWGVWSVGGRCLAWAVGVEESEVGSRFQDTFMYGVKNLFWMPGNLELCVLAGSFQDDNQLFTIPFAKSAVTGQHSPDNTRYAFLQMDDRVLVYRGADQPDMSVINPESDVWQHIKIPLSYIAINWPIRFASISNDGRLIAVAGRRGLIHYSTASGRWKMFADEGQEQAITVRGGLVWFHHVLIAGVEVARSHQVRLYSRDLELSNMNVLHREMFPAAVILLSLVDNSLLVYTADNTLYHFLIIPTEESIKLHLCGSISFDGVVALPSAVRGMSWMIPPAQKNLGDPVDDLIVATILLLVGGRLVLLRPRKAGAHEVKYDMQILADRVEFCWIHLRGIGTLENSLWGYDGKNIRLWLDALTIDSAAGAVDQQRDMYESVKESVKIELDFYPLSVLMDKGIIIGVEHEILTRNSLPFVMFKIQPNTHLFLHHVLRYHLGRRQVREAVSFASHYQNLVFFAHALEILLHTVVEAEAELEDDGGDGNNKSSEDEDESKKGVLPVVIEFLDHFDAALDVVVGCARKTEMARWKRLFGIVGDPQILFETCLSSNLLKTAGSYLLVLHNLEDEQGHGSEGSTNANAIRLLKKAKSAQDWALCQDILRFLRSIDDSGWEVRSALTALEE
ncbi:hypothetical protein FRC02_004160 [Tulasnella sp. 418]|nr:hypothetical protein FRC02_004160 [Tulasnella sp. 418]